MKESDLFGPIKAFFEAEGFQGDGEVAGIDLLLEKDGLTVAVELKKTLDFRAVQQAALDQKTCDFAYIGIFRPRDLFSASGKDKLYLLKRLGIGLICVSPRSGNVEVVSQPVISEISAFQRLHKKEAAAIVTELQKRKVRGNTGGVSKTKLVTAYREDSLSVLKALKSLGGEGSCREIRTLTGCPKTTSILYDNYYGWFERAARGVYRIGPKGEEALTAYRDTLEKL